MESSINLKPEERPRRSAIGRERFKSDGRNRLGVTNGVETAVGRLRSGRAVAAPAASAVTSGRGRISGGAPLAALDLFDDDPGERPHVLAFNRSDCLGQPANHVPPLRRREETLTYTYVDQWNGALLFGLS
jgi:hypothetical protein